MARKRTAEPKKRTVYVVERLSWHFWWDDHGGSNQPVCNDNNSGDEQGGVPVAAFADRVRAKKLCAELEREGRAEVCPFQFNNGEPECLSSKSDEEFIGTIREMGLEPPFAPKRGYVNWYHWWQKVEPRVTPLQREAVWDLLDQVKLYRVVKCELEG